MPEPSRPRDDLLSRSLLPDVLVTYGAKLASLLFGLATTVVIARYLGPTGRGTVAVAISLTQLLAQFGTVGIVAANPYFVAGRTFDVNRLIGSSLALAFGLGPLLAAGGAVIKILWPGALGDVEWDDLLLALAGLPAILATQFLQSLLLGEARMLAYNGIEAGIAALTLAALLVGFTAFNLGPTGAIALTTTAAYVALFTAASALIARHGGPRAPTRTLLRELIAYGIRIYLATLLAFCLVRFDLLLVGSYLGASEAGIYSVVAALTAGIIVLPTVVGLNLFTRVAAGAGAQLTAAVFRLTLPVYAAVCLASVPAARAAIPAAFGSDFEPAVALYYWILPGAFFLGMLTILSHHFAGEGFPIQALLAWVCGLAVNILLNVLFLEQQGTFIASLSSSIGYGLVLALYIRIFARETGARLLLPRVRDLQELVHIASGRRSHLPQSR